MLCVRSTGEQWQLEAMATSRAPYSGVVHTLCADVTPCRPPCRASVLNGFRSALARKQTETLRFLRGHSNVAATFIIASAIIFFPVISRGVVLARGAYVTLRRLPCRAFVHNGFRTALVRIRIQTETLAFLSGHAIVAAPCITASAISGCYSSCCTRHQNDVPRPTSAAYKRPLQAPPTSVPYTRLLQAPPRSAPYTRRL